MIKKILIPLFFFSVTLVVTAFSQSSEQAIMRVSAEVVSGVNVETVQPERIGLSEDKISNLGMLFLNGENDGNKLITYSDKIELENSSGHKIMLNISSKRQKRDENFDSIQFEGESKQSKAGMVNGTYRGKLTTTVEYF